MKRVQRETFLASSKKLLSVEKPSANNASAKGANQLLAIDKDVRDKLNDILLKSIGPIASMLLKKALGQAQNMEGLLEILVSSFEEGDKRDTFLQQASKIIN